MSLNDYPNTNTQPGITRGADLSAAGKALLYFDYATTAGVDPGDEVSLEIAADGKNFTVLQKFTNIYGKTANSRRYDITKFMSANTRVRFRVTRLYGGPNEFFLVDNLTIEAHKVAAVGLMQAVTNRITLSPGPLSIFDSDGSALIVHVDPDTYCPKGEQAGCAGGARAACGIIQFVND